MEPDRTVIFLRRAAEIELKRPLKALLSPQGCLQHKIGKIHWSRSIGLFSSLSDTFIPFPAFPFFYDPNESFGCRSAERSQPDLWCRTSRWWYYNSDCTWAWTSDGILSQGSCGCKSMARYAGRIIFRKFFLTISGKICNYMETPCEYFNWLKCKEGYRSPRVRLELLPPFWRGPPWWLGVLQTLEVM